MHVRLITFAMSPSCRRSYSPSFPLTIRPPPTSTLFPYTTLFRSWHLTLRPRARTAVRDVARPPRFRPDLDRRDRKSTRLNSSHLGISYAVFCLKKKSIWFRQVGDV